MYVLVDMEWISNQHGNHWPTQLAAARVDAQWPCGVETKHSSHWLRSLKVRRFCSEGIMMICLIIGIKSSSLTSPIIVRSVKVSTDNRISSA